MPSTTTPRHQSANGGTGGGAHAPSSSNWDPEYAANTGALDALASEIASLAAGVRESEQGGGDGGGDERVANLLAALDKLPSVVTSFKSYEVYPYFYKARIYSASS